MKGLTNLIKFDHQGFRTDFLLDIIELSPSGLRRVGCWNSTQGVNFTRTYGEQQQEIAENLRNKTLIVTTLLVNGNLEATRFYSDPDPQQELTSSNSFFSLLCFIECTILHAKRFRGETKWKRPIRRLCYRSNL